MGSVFVFFLFFRFSGDFYAESQTERLHARGALGGDRHHWGFGRFVTSGGASCSGGGASDVLWQQHSSARFGDLEL
jgi:hypothetical protein